MLSGLTTNTLRNIGGFTIETVLSRDAVIIPADGNYEISTTITGLAAASILGTARSTLVAQFVRDRGGVDTTLLPQGTPSYSRNQYGEYSQLLGSHMSTVLALEAGDKIRVQVLYRVQSANPALSITGARSNLTITGVDSPTVSATADVDVTVNVAGLVGSVIDVSGEDIESPTEDDKGSVWYNAYKHDLAFAIRKFYAGTAATGSGTEYTDTDYFGPLNYAPNASVSDQIWYRPSNDTWYVSNAARQWFVTPFDELPATADIPTDSTTYTGGAVFLGQFDTANDAANGIVAADYDATIQYFFYDRGDQRVEWLSAYTAPVTQEPFWDILHVLTDENRITPHPVGDKYEVAALSGVNMFEDTGILLPEIGWIDLVGFVAATGRFSLHIPVSAHPRFEHYRCPLPDMSNVATSSAHFATGDGLA